MTAYEFELPDPGEGLTEAELVEWHVEEGDDIEEHDVLCEVETDKAVTDVPSPCPGTIEERRVEPGDVVQVGEVVAVIETDSPPSGGDEAEAAEEAAEEADTEQETKAEEEGSEEAQADAEEETEPTEESEEESVAEEAAEEETEPAEETATEESESDEAEESQVEEEAESEAEGEESQSPTTSEDRVFAAPRTRAYAREQGVDLSDIDGSGPNGRVVRDDIDARVSGGTTGETAETGDEATYAIEHPTTEIEPVEIDEDEERAERRDLSGLRARIAENMSRSAAVVPQLTSGFQADATELVELKERLDAEHDVHITYTPILLKAVVPALKEFPMVNASIDDTTDEIVEKYYYNVGCATHTESGLMVPVIKDIDSKSIVEVARELSDLTEQARERSIDAADMQDGTFTVTNLASFGEHRTFGTPIINYPEVAIMGIGRIREEPVATEDGEVEVRPQIDLSLSYDHRLVDGAKANQFMEYVIDGIEDTDLLLGRL
ncbi:dihydrolipoamide acetyltransferase family protein [Haladaptatus sp. CMAA 1911]|uniref:dihydrolipoamide acetyltransferase family protein n=1 Tax=unclassified Haladaptatus TaxID=2622732 RepID=UPI0037545545